MIIKNTEIIIIARSTPFENVSFNNYEVCVYGCIVMLGNTIILLYIYNSLACIFLLFIIIFRTKHTYNKHLACTRSKTLHRHSGACT